MQFDTKTLRLPYNGAMGLDRLDVCCFCGCEATRWTVTKDMYQAQYEYKTSSFCASCFDGAIAQSEYYESAEHDTWHNIYARVVTAKITRDMALVLRIMNE